MLQDSIQFQPAFQLPQIPAVQQASKKRFGRAISELMLANVVPWFVVRYGIQDNYARITSNSVRYNLDLRHWAWDNDNFQVNQIGHPFHGSLFYNSFRSNGYTFWQSIPAPFLGSYIWETFAETQAPSINDQINAGLGGVIMGEAIHRFTKKIINGKSRGFRRQAGEVFSFLINPMNGFNRLLDGKWGKAPANHSEIDASILHTSIDFGFRNFHLNEKSPFRGGGFGIYGRLRFLYENPEESRKVPFSRIAVLIDFGQDKSSKLNILNIIGSLSRWKLNTGKIQQEAALTANYDYINNEVFYLGYQSIMMNLNSETRLSDKLNLNTSLGAGPVILAAVPSSYMYEGRPYDYGAGFTYNIKGQLDYHQNIFYVINLKGMWTTTINGNAATYFLHTITNEIAFKVINQFYVSTELGHFVLNGNYKRLPDARKDYPYLRFSIRYLTNL